MCLSAAWCWAGSVQCVYQSSYAKKTPSYLHLETRLIKEVEDKNINKPIFSIKIFISAALKRVYSPFLSSFSFLSPEAPVCCQRIKCLLATRNTTTNMCMGTLNQDKNWFGVILCLWNFTLASNYNCITSYMKICFVIVLSFSTESFYVTCRPSCCNPTRITFHLRRCLLVIFSDIFAKDITLKYWLLAASIQNDLCWPLTARIGAILVCNSTPGQHKPAAQTHSSHVHIYCSVPNTSLWLPTVHWPSAVFRHLKSDFTGKFTVLDPYHSGESVQ